MPTRSPPPGPDAHRAFRTGMYVAAIAALGGVGGLYWAGFMGVGFALFLLVVLFPVYLLVVASALSRWLGFGKDVTDLRPVRRGDGDQSFWENGR